MLADADAAHSLSSYGGVGHLYSRSVFLLRSSGFGDTASFPSPNSTVPLAEGDGVGYGFEMAMLLDDCLRLPGVECSSLFMARRVDVKTSSKSSSSSSGAS